MIKNNLFECDKNKARSNLKKHSIRFTEAARIFDSHTLTAPSNKQGITENRYTSIGVIADDCVITIIWTRRKNHIRLISARNSRKNEKERYYANIQKTLN